MASLPVKAPKMFDKSIINQLLVDDVSPAKIAKEIEIMKKKCIFANANKTR